MAADVTIPRLGWSMEEGVFAGWLKQPGDTVKPGEPLFMLEGEKATQEIEAVDGGVLHLAPDTPVAGQTVLVGRVIATLCGPGETPAWAGNPRPVVPVPVSAAADADARPAASADVAPPLPTSAAVAHAEVPAAASPSVRRLARQMGIDLATVTRSLPGGRVSIADLAPARATAAPAQHATGPTIASGPSRSSPRARRAARERGIDITTIRGGGAGGRVRERDVLATTPGTPQQQAAADLGSGIASGATVPITPIRRTIARQMVRSRQETVPVTLTAWADATELFAARAAFKAAASADANHADEIPAVHDMLLKAVADALRGHPLLAARWEETHLALPGDRIDIGLAVDTPHGLVVPVIRDVAASSLADVARQSRWLIERARTGRLVAADMQGGVFTLTSLGSFGIEFFTPVINHPEAAILGVGAMRMQPLPQPGAENGLVFQRQLPLSLTFDHRIVDGGPAARFLADLAAGIAAVDPARS